MEVKLPLPTWIRLFEDNVMRWLPPCWPSLSFSPTWYSPTPTMSASVTVTRARRVKVTRLLILTCTRGGFLPLLQGRPPVWVLTRHAQLYNLYYFRWVINKIERIHTCLIMTPSQWSEWISRRRLMHCGTWVTPWHRSCPAWSRSACTRHPNWSLRTPPPCSSSTSKLSTQQHNLNP